MKRRTKFINPAFALVVLACFGLLPVLQATDIGSVVPPQGNANTADGAGVLLNLTTGINNSGFGYFALGQDTSGSNNTAIGRTALLHNMNGSFNTATGVDALRANTGGLWNTATGYRALYSNLTGIGNTANGLNALRSNTNASGNTALGAYSLYTTSTGGANTAIGYQALYSTTGTGNIAIGNGAGKNYTTGSNNIDIGNVGVGGVGESTTIRIGTVGTHNAAFIAGISVSSIAGAAVLVNGNGRLGVAASSARFKDEIKPMDKASEAILALKPVTFRYKEEIDPERLQQFGLVAEEVEKVNPALVTRDGDGKVFTVRYEAINAMLLNEFLKEHRKMEQLKNDFQATVAEQQKEIQALTAQLKEQAAQIQKVSAQLEVSKAAPQTVLNN
jgi:hypothetical protein